MFKCRFRVEFIYFFELIRLVFVMLINVGYNGLIICRIFWNKYNYKNIFLWLIVYYVLGGGWLEY